MRSTKSDKNSTLKWGQFGDDADYKFIEFSGIVTPYVQQMYTRQEKPKFQMIIMKQKIALAELW